MRAICLEKYGAVDSMKCLERPTPKPEPGEVQIKVHFSAINPADFKVGLGQVKFLHARNFPMTLGYDFSGEITKIGEGVTDKKVGDAVYGHLPYGPFNKRGAFAEFVIAKANEVAIKPETISHAQASAAATPGLTALQSLRDLGHLKSGGKVLITGVSGGVGSIGISVARKLGGDVTAIGSGEGVILAQKLGASDVIDRKKMDVFSVQGPFDVVFDAAAAYRWTRWKSKIKSKGQFVTTLPSLGFMADKIQSALSSSGVHVVTVKSKAKDLDLLARWLSEGMDVSIDRVIPVRDVAQGFRALEAGGIVGRIVVDVINGF